MHRVFSIIILFAIFNTPSSSLGGNPLLKTLEPDGVVWKFEPLEDGLIVIGDLHGDFQALLSILISRGVITPDGEWALKKKIVNHVETVVGKKLHLAITGDFVHRGPDSRLIIDFLIYLQGEALRYGSHVHVLPGNHELQVLLTKNMDASLEELASYVDLAQDFNFYHHYDDEVSYKDLGIYDAFRGNTKYAEWLNGLNTIVQIGDTLLVHAGVKKWLLDHPPDRINATIRTWVRHLQGLESTQPDHQTSWILGNYGSKFGLAHSDGPLQTRDLSKQLVPKADVEDICRAYGLARIVVGHEIDVNKVRVLYGGLVYAIDTGMTRKFKGQISSLQVKGSTVDIEYASRIKLDHPLYVQARESLEKTLRSQISESFRDELIMQSTNLIRYKKSRAALFILAHRYARHPKEVKAVLDALSNPKLLRTALYALSVMKLNSPEVRNALAFVLQNSLYGQQFWKTAEVQKSAIVAFTAIDARQPEVLQLISHFMTHGDDDVKRVAIRALGQLGVSSSSILMKLAEMVKRQSNMSVHAAYAIRKSNPKLYNIKKSLIEALGGVYSEMPISDLRDYLLNQKPFENGLLRLLESNFMNLKNNLGSFKMNMQFEVLSTYTQLVPHLEEIRVELEKLMTNLHVDEGHLISWIQEYITVLYQDVRAKEFMKLFLVSSRSDTTVIATMNVLATQFTNDAMVHQLLNKAQTHPSNIIAQMAKQLMNKIKCN